MTRTRTIGSALAVSLAGACLLTTTTFAQQEHPTRRPVQQEPARKDMPRANDRTGQQRINFVTYSTLADTNVVNSNGDEIGSISDIIVERGSGQAKFFVLQSGDWAGLGGRLTAIPVDVFGWDGTKGNAVLDATAEQLAMLPEFSADKWEGLSRPDSTWDELKQALALESDDDRDPYIMENGSATPIALSGNITEVERRNTAAGEEIVIHVQSERFGEDSRTRPGDPSTRDDRFRGDEGTDRPGTRPQTQPRDRDAQQQPGNDRQADRQQSDRRPMDAGANTVRVVLGPSWYVMSQPTAPMRGYSFEGEVVRMSTEATDRDAAGYVALSAEINGEELALRDTDSHEPRWNTDARRTDRDSATGSVRAPFALLSDIDGADVQCRGQDSGKVSDVILDQHSCKVAFLVVDPDENFLGIADTNRLVPWHAANVGSDGTVRVDASKEMVLNSRELPEDLNTLEQRDGYMAIYSAYELDEPEFKPLKRRDWNEVTSLGGWSSDTDFVGSIDDAEEMQIEGTVVRIERKEPTRNMSRATILVVNSEQGNQNVLLGPSWYVDRQDMPFRVGDQVTITAKNATVNGQPMIVACRVQEGDGEKELLLWQDNKPAWDRR